MKSILFVTAATVIALSATTPAEAQRAGSGGPIQRAMSAPQAPRAVPIRPQAVPVPAQVRPMPMRAGPPRTMPPGRFDPPRHGGRWGSKIGGRWSGGMQAPGGWSAYRRPVRGWTLPGYWMGGRFGISDYASWGLVRPPHGYFWVRYYDDAVLVDRGGRVWDSVSGLDWDGDAYAADGYGADYDAPGYDEDDDRYELHRRGDRQLPPPPACMQRCVVPSGYASGYYAGGYYIVPPTTTVVIVGGGTTTKTVVTEEVIESGSIGSRRVVRRAPTKLIRRGPGKQLYR
ncbi:RcnB family protein [Sphingomonas turrisvirgatae]|uniref:RcnB family protein n=1 Tax=Sphingomonas turrisvirgatae TaxID=1888892 RepID=UPI000A408907|nr:RcnB family protein [Sphingomonas turrisvirgatae]